MVAQSKNIHIPPLPKVAREIMSLLYRPEPDFAQLVRIIATDAGLCGDIFKLSNSAQAGAQQSTTNLMTAVSRLGLTTLRLLVMMHAMSTSFKLHLNCGIDNMEYWRHGAFVGHIAFELSKIRFKEHAADMQLAGLLHDAGVLILATHEPENLKTQIELCRKSGTSLAHLELNTGAEAHRKLSKQLVESWGLSLTVGMLVGLHDVTDHNRRGVLTATQHQLVDILILSDSLAHRYGFGLNQYKGNVTFSSQNLQTVGIGSTEILAAVQTVKSFLTHVS